MPTGLLDCNAAFICIYIAQAANIKLKQPCESPNLMLDSRSPLNRLLMSRTMEPLSPQPTPSRFQRRTKPKFLTMDMPSCQWNPESLHRRPSFVVRFPTIYSGEREEQIQRRQASPRNTLHLVLISLFARSYKEASR
jgi:hypothetical protein